MDNPANNPYRKGKWSCKDLLRCRAGSVIVGPAGRAFPQSILMKEVLVTAARAVTTGTVSHRQKRWFVMPKDSKNSHFGNRLWGEGWPGHGSMPPMLKDEPIMRGWLRLL